MNPLGNATPISGSPPLEPYQTGTITRRVFPWAKRFFEWGPQFDQWVQHQKTAPAPGETLSVIGRAKNATFSAVNWLVQKLVDYDYREFPMLLKRFKISEPPIGALILLLFPFTILPRVLRAFKRDKREVGDVLRRDLTAITILVFALKPLVNLLNKLKEKWDGLRLVTPFGEKAGQVFTYTQMKKLYPVLNPDVLIALIQTGNEEGLKKAATRCLLDGGLAHAGHPELKAFITQFQSKLDPLIQAVKNETPEAQGLAKEAFSLLEKMDGVRQEFVQAAEKGANASIVKMANSLPNFKNFVVEYAKTRRLPVDILSFLIVCIGIGWFPVWFNDLWNRKKFAEKMAQKRAQEAANFNPSMTYQALKQSSRLARGFNS